MVILFRVCCYKVFTMAFGHWKDCFYFYVDLDTSFAIDWMSQTAYDVFVVY